MFVPIFTLQFSYVNSEAAKHGFNIKVAVLKIFENFQENIRGEVKYEANFGMKGCNFTNLVLQHGSVSNFSRFAKELSCSIAVNNCFCIL